VAATPLILTGLAVTVPFRAGLFNIGGEGQVIVGGTVAGLVGFSFTGLPAVVHLPLALLAGLAGGALYGALPGLLKARTGAHEVITTIMLNNIAGLVLIEVLVSSLFQAPGRSDPISKTIADSAALPTIGEGFRLDAGLLVALAAGAAVWWLLTRSTLGFEIRAVGANAVAATTAGMSAARTTVITMAIAGGLAGLGGAGLILGAAGQGSVTPGFASGVGFDGITVALLGRGKPWGTVVAGVVFGALKAGGRTMQSQTGTPVDLVLVIQALVILFIAAPVLIRALFRLKQTSEATGGVAAGWGA
jgi:simple sugar transport system permease protein